MSRSLLSDNVRGALLITASTGAFVVNDGFMKSVTETLDLFQALALRGGLPVLYLYGLAIIMEGRRSVRACAGDVRNAFVGGRILFELVATSLFLLALMKMQLIDLLAVNQALPVFLTIGGILMFGERAGAGRLIAIAVCIVGVMLIIRPGSSAFTPAALIGLGATAAMAARDLLTKRVPRVIPSIYIAAHTTLMVWIMSLCVAAFSDWPPLTTDIYLKILASSFTIAAAFLLTILGTRVGEMSFQAPFRYSSLIWGIIVGGLFFGEVPSLTTMAGAVIVICAGLYLLFSGEIGRRRLATRA